MKRVLDLALTLVDVRERKLERGKYLIVPYPLGSEQVSLSVTDIVVGNGNDVVEEKD